MTQESSKPEKKQKLFSITNILLAAVIIYFIANTAYRLMGGG